MGFILWLFLFVAIATIFYSIRMYRKNPTYQYKKAKSQQHFYMMLEKHLDKAPSIELTYKGVDFKGFTEVGIDETSIKVMKVTLHLSESFEVLKGWKRDDFYTIEKEIYIQYPYADILWDEPVNNFLKQLDNPIIE